MGMNEIFAALLKELDRTHAPGFNKNAAFRDDGGLPQFATAANGEVRHFHRPARELLVVLTDAVYCQHTSLKKRIDEHRFATLVRQAVTDLHASDALISVTNPFQALVDELTKRVDTASQTFVHSLPAWTTGFEEAGEWTIGPVTFMTWPQWIRIVDFPDQAKASFEGEPQVNACWKELLLKWMEDPTTPSPSGLASTLTSAVDPCPAVLRVEVNGFERNLSRKLAKIVCKGALDAVSLLIGQRRAFVQQALQEERLPPRGFDMIVESNGHLWIPGGSLTDRVGSIDGSEVRQLLQVHQRATQAMGYALNGLLDRSHLHPQLASRWATSLDWFAEGERESSDAIALAKLATSLDVLAGGGKFQGILNLIKNLLGPEENSIFTQGVKTKTLRTLVKDIYNSGRSKILHGTRHDRMEAFEHDRNAAAYFARLALISAAVRLKDYRGDDTDAKAFQTMEGTDSSSI